jgi:hypothetical protein
MPTHVATINQDGVAQAIQCDRSQGIFFPQITIHFSLLLAHMRSIDQPEIAVLLHCTVLKTPIFHLTVDAAQIAEQSSQLHKHTDHFCATYTCTFRIVSCRRFCIVRRPKFKKCFFSVQRTHAQTYRSFLCKRTHAHFVSYRFGSTKFCIVGRPKFKK